MAQSCDTDSSKLLLPIELADAPANASAMCGATPRAEAAEANEEAGTSALESMQVATKEQHAEASPIKKRALENVKVPRRSNRIINNKKKETDQEQQKKKKAKHEASVKKVRIDRVRSGRQARDAENHRRTLREIRDELRELAADDEENDIARDAAKCIIRAIDMMLQQDPIDYSLGRILQEACGSNDESLLDELDEDLGESLGVWQWEWLHKHGYVQQSAPEFVAWLLLYVPVELSDIGFADMCDRMALHYANEMPVLPSPSSSDILARDWPTTSDDDNEEASVDNRISVAANNKSIDHTSHGSSSSDEAPRRRRKRQ